MMHTTGRGRLHRWLLQQRSFAFHVGLPVAHRLRAEHGRNLTYRSVRNYLTTTQVVILHFGESQK